MAQTIAPPLLSDQVQESGLASQNDSESRFWGSSRATFTAGFTASLDLFLQSLEGRSFSPSTIRAYGTDLRQFLAYLTETNELLSRLDEVTQDDLHEYLAALGKQGRSGVTRARKLASIREFFKCLVTTKVVEISPAEKVAIPRKE
jgi:integrase/recombinase XerC